MFVYGFYLSKQTQCGFIARQATSAFSRHRFRRRYKVIDVITASWRCIQVHGCWSKLISINSILTGSSLYGLLWTLLFIVPHVANVLGLREIKNDLIWFDLLQNCLKSNIWNKLTNNFTANCDVDTALSTAALIRGHSAGVACNIPVSIPIMHPLQNSFLISQSRPVLRVLKVTISMRRLFWAPKTQVQIHELDINYIAMLKMSLSGTMIDITCMYSCYINKISHHPQMHSHTKFWIPISNNIWDMLLTQLLLKLAQRSRLQWPENGMWHSTIHRCIYTSNLEFLPQRI